jgi:hypothetical protein
MAHVQARFCERPAAEAFRESSGRCAGRGREAGAFEQDSDLGQARDLIRLQRFWILAQHWLPQLASVESHLLVVATRWARPALRLTQPLGSFAGECFTQTDREARATPRRSTRAERHPFRDADGPRAALTLDTHEAGVGRGAITRGQLQPERLAAREPTTDRAIFTVGDTTLGIVLFALGALGGETPIVAGRRRDRIRVVAAAGHERAGDREQPAWHPRAHCIDHGAEDSVQRVRGPTQPIPERIS